MFGFSMVQMVRNNADRLDRYLREECLHLYRPFKRTPCFLHRPFENWLKNTKKIPVIIQFQNNNDHIIEEDFEQVKDIVGNHFRCKQGKEFKCIGSCSATVTPKALEELLSTCNHIQKVYYNREVKALLDVATPSVHAQNVVRDNTELTGEDVTIAVIDTGIHPHEDLEGRIKGFRDFVNNRTEPYDDNGHGTHCAGDAAGDGSMSDGRYAGPAPKADVVGIKVLDRMGSGSLDTVMEGVQWAIDNKDTLGINVLSMSLGSPANPAYPDEDDDPMVQIVEAAWEEGIVVCVAAGNEGPNRSTIASPGISDKVITVGAMDDQDTVNREDDEIASFSSRGPTIHGETKPDVVAPGVNIISLRAPGSYLDKVQKSARVEGNYMVLSGTSMATPICAGVVALILENNRDLTPEQVKSMLMERADNWGNGDPNVYGAGYIHAENTIPS
ncbi:S8 family serine peptidase [Ornithinibacillus sp. L9]|uniref:S8 family serine peptidase n=1 Tax=Ornithinibacillus caprae TaxID=2678566 RepID=A0A6N8FFP2_9BACI|nr:S8 family peptidase [Ornithinibacillus caprae]MUK88255.1 S8 family serine peptidase [Ornithinibacillus caprae]